MRPTPPTRHREPPCFSIHHSVLLDPAQNQHQKSIGNAQINDLKAELEKANGDISAMLQIAGQCSGVRRLIIFSRTMETALGILTSDGRSEALMKMSRSAPGSKPLASN
jgi:hypothetical protein